MFPGPSETEISRIGDGSILCVNRFHSLSRRSNENGRHEYDNLQRQTQQHNVGFVSFPMG